MFLKFFTTIIFCISLLNVFAAEEKKVETKVENKAEVKKSDSAFSEPISGKVTEKIDAASYTYLKVKTKTDEVWVAVPQTDVKVNTDVELEKPMPMFGFQSKTLNRKFDRIYFGVLKTQKEEMAKMRAETAKEAPKNKKNK